MTVPASRWPNVMPAIVSAGMTALRRTWRDSKAPLPKPFACATCTNGCRHVVRKLLVRTWAMFAETGIASVRTGRTRVLGVWSPNEGNQCRVNENSSSSTRPSQKGGNARARGGSDCSSWRNHPIRVLEARTAIPTPSTIATAKAKTASRIVDPTPWLMMAITDWFCTIDVPKSP
jgi:hypothetical protein